MVLEALLAGVTRSGANLTFPNDVNAANVNATGNVNAGVDVNAGTDVVAGFDVIAGNDVTATNDVNAIDDVNAGGSFINNGVPLNAP